MSIFTDRDPFEGKIGIGQLPDDFHPLLDNIAAEYYDIIPDKNASTYHVWYKNMPTNIRAKVDQIQSNAFWNSLCDGNPNCKIVDVSEMNELYYSNFTSTSNTTASKNYYGATGNIVIHKDCHHICSFPNVALYRILIGLSDNDNDNIITKFTHFDVGHKINKNDYVLFDFARTTHQVVKLDPNIKTPRILLKMHFIVFENDDYSDLYIDSVKQYFIQYDHITRYILSTGTNPETYFAFFVGLFTYFFYYPYISYFLAAIIISIVVLLRYVFKIKLKYKNIPKLIRYVFYSITVMYLFVVFFYWVRYQMFGIR